MKTVEQTLIEAGRAYTIAAASGNVIGYVGDDGAGGAQLSDQARQAVGHRVGCPGGQQHRHGHVRTRPL